MALQKVTMRLVSPVLTLVVLGGLTVERFCRPDIEDAVQYHQQVSLAISRVPYQIGDWSGTDVDVPPAAIRLLHPNAILSRRYDNLATNQSVALLIVHCRDARDIAGHYPPVCYPANGWVQRYLHPMHLQVTPERSIDGAEYEFAMWLPASLRIMRVVNVLVLPDGTTTHDMKHVREAAADYRTHFFGAGQIQLAFAEHLRTQQREEILRTFIKALEPVLAAIESGVEK